MDTIPTIELPISKIIIDDKILPREKISEKHVKNLAKALEEGAELPPLDIFYDGKTYFLADGHHRYEAFIKAGLKTIETVIHKGDKRDAFIYSCGVNAKHGLPLTKPDKRKVVERLLQDGEWCAFSDGIIAEHCAVSPQYVGKVRHKLTRNGFESPSIRLGKDGRTIETDKIGKNSGDADRERPINPVKESIPVTVKTDKDSLPPKVQGKGKKWNSGTYDEHDQDKLSPIQDPSITISETKKLISDLQDGLQTFDRLLLIEGKIRKSKEKNLQNQWERIKPLWSKFAAYVSTNFDWIY